MFGGVRAVAYTDFKQMFAVVASLITAVVVLIIGLPESVGVGDALRIAGTTGRLQMFDFRLDFTEQYTFWSGTIAALFLFLSYFGTDQSQVQRYLSAKSEDEARSSLLMSAFWKIPLQALVLIVGVLMFTFYLFTQPPMLFNPVHDGQVRSSARAAEYTALEQQFDAAIEQRRDRGDPVCRGRRKRPADRHGGVQERGRRSEARARRRRRHRQRRVRRSLATTTSTTCFRPSSRREFRWGLRA